MNSELEALAINDTKKLPKFGYTQSNSDYSMFILLEDDQIIVLIIYVNNVTLKGTSLYEFDNIKNIRHNKLQTQRRKLSPHKESVV